MRMTLLCPIVLLLPALRAQVTVDPPGDPVQQFAAGELTRYLRLIDTGKVPRIRIGSDCQGEAACLAPGDAFRIRRERNGVISIRGRNSRGALYGVYALLERLGVRWFGPGAVNEYLPPRRPINWNAPLELAESPAIPERILYYWPYHYQPLEEWIDYAAKARLNRFCFHYGWPTLDWYMIKRDTLLPELRKRGIIVEIGGHLLTTFLPRSLFAEHADWFRMSESGQRVADWNMNPFSQPALDYVSSRLADYFARTPEATMFHAWPDDIQGRGWSYDPARKQYNPSDQALLVANAVVTALRQKLPHAQVPFLGYHDTVEPPRMVKPAPGILYFWAPRERCYAHGLADPACGINAVYRKEFENALPVFSAANTEVFEYYVDHVLFQNTANPPLGDVIAADTRYYAKLGVPRLGSLVVNTAEWVTPPVNLFLFPQVLWNPQRDLGESIADYARAYFGDGRMKDYFAALDAGMKDMIRICAYTRPGDSWDHVQPDNESDAAVGAHVRGLEDALTGPLARASVLLNDALKRATGSPRRHARLVAERNSLDYTLLQGRLFYHMLKGHWLLKVAEHTRDREAGMTGAAEATLARYTWTNLKAFIATSRLRGEPLMPDPEVLARRARSFARANGCTIDNLGHLMMTGTIGYTVNGPGGSRAVLWADAPGAVLNAPGVTWFDEFGRRLERAPDLGRAPAVIHSSQPIDQVMKTLMSPPPLLGGRPRLRSTSGSNNL
jgi:hypothetical protein